MNKSTLAIAVMAASTAAVAQERPYEPHSYNFAQYQRSNITYPTSLLGMSGKIKAEVDRWSVSLQHELGPLLQLSYTDGKITDVFGESPSSIGERLSVKAYGVLVGGASQLTEATSAWGGFGYEYIEYKSRLLSASTDTDSYRFGAGVRHSTIIPHVEANGQAFVVHDDARDGGSETDLELEAGFLVRPLPYLAGGMSYLYRVDNETRSWNMHIRVEF